MKIPLECQICGEKLRLGYYLTFTVWHRKETYPFRFQDGTRKEMPVERICRSCRRRRKRAREQGDLAPAGD